MTFDSVQTIHLISEAGLAYDPYVKLVIDEEGAEYIATVMAQEYRRTGDRGAEQIANRIRLAMNVSVEGDAYDLA